MKGNSIFISLQQKQNAAKSIFLKLLLIITFFHVQTCSRFPSRFCSVSEVSMLWPSTNLCRLTSRTLLPPSVQQTDLVTALMLCPCPDPPLPLPGMELTSLCHISQVKFQPFLKSRIKASSFMKSSPHLPESP
jgi:hypothetical protein